MKELKLEVGKTYKTRDGRKLAIKRQSSDSCIYFGYVAGDITRSWEEDGSKRHKNSEAYRKEPAGAWDAIELWPEAASVAKPPLKLETGKAYVTRDGRRVDIKGPSARDVFGSVIGSDTNLVWEKSGIKKFKEDKKYAPDPDAWDIVGLWVGKYKVGDRYKGNLAELTPLTEFNAAKLVAGDLVVCLEGSFLCITEANKFH